MEFHNLKSSLREVYHLHFSNHSPVTAYPGQATIRYSLERVINILKVSNLICHQAILILYVCAIK